MKIAVTYDNGNIFQHFGKTENFKIYEVEDHNVISSEVIGSNGTGHGALAGLLAEQSVDVLICGGIGGGAQAALAEAKALRDEMPNILRQADVDAAAEKLNNVKLSLQGADYTALDEIIAEAKALLETNLSDKYTNVSIDVMKAALVEAENIDRELDVSDQDYVDAAAQALRNAIDALNPYNKVTGVQITQNGQVVDGDVAYVKVPWYKTYKSQSTTLGYQLSSDANVASVKWELANWSVENPEADIIDNGDGTVTIKPNGKGIGARSCWVKVTVTDVNGNTVEDIVKVRFYNWDWQK